MFSIEVTCDIMILVIYEIGIEVGIEVGEIF